MMPPSHSDNLNTSVLSSGANGPTGGTPTGNQNYRKAFKPNLGGQSQSSYEPERRSPNQARRNLSSSIPAYDSSKYEQEKEPSPPRQQARGRPSPMQSQPKQGPKPTDLDQPTGLGIKAANGLSIYEQAAMQANPFSAPDEADQDDGQRVPCPTCGRNFREAALEKHEKICKKVFV
jgi:hypothetical protein